MTYLFVVVAIVAIAAAVAFYFQFAAQKAESDRRGSELSDVRASAEKARKELESIRDEFARKKSEAADLREKLTSVRQRSHKQREQDKRQKAGNLASLTDELESARRLADEESARADVLERELKGAQDAFAATKQEVARLDAALKNVQAQAERVAVAPVATTAVAAVAPPSQEAELRARVEQLESQIRDARRKATQAEEEAKKARGKAATASRQQLLTKGELDLFREKLVWSEKRVVELEKLAFENKLALPEREPAPQPAAPQPAPGMSVREGVNTGGEGVVAEAADYEPEETSTEPQNSPAAAEEVVPAVAQAEEPAGGEERPEPAPVSSEVAQATAQGEQSVEAAKGRAPGVKRRPKSEEDNAKA